MSIHLLPRVQAAGLLFTLLLLVCSAPAADQATVEGKFLGNGKDGNIRHVIVETREPFSDKPAINITFTEKDPSSSKKPSFDAGFKKLGSALLLSVFRDGDIFGCEVAHSAHAQSPFSSLGQIKVEDMVVTDTTVSGRVVTDGEINSFDQQWSVDLKFSAPLPKGAFAGAPEAKPAAPEEDAEPAAPAGPAPSASSLPLPASAEDVTSNPLVGQLSFRSAEKVPAVTKDFSAKLAGAGWKEAAGSLKSPSNAMMRWSKDGATLTIMIQPAPSGCSVKVMAQGLDWSDAPAGAPAPAGADEAAGAEAEADRLIKDALKQIPGF
jgi:hypothetical protein